MYAIPSFEQWQVIGFNKDGTQHKICAAHSSLHLLKEFTKYLQRAEANPVHREVLDSFKAIKVWDIDQGFTGLDLPSITN